MSHTPRPTPSRLRAALALALMATLLAVAAARSLRSDSWLELDGQTMGTTWSVRVSAPAAEGPALRATVQGAVDEVDRLMSTWKPDSELSHFNAAPAGELTAISQPTAEVFAVAQTVHRASGGAFDVTVGPLVDAWGFGAGATGEAPTEELLVSLLADVGQRHVHLDTTSAPPTLSKDLARLRCDLSAVAKGYGVDRAAAALHAAGASRFLVEVGGEVRAAGERPQGGPWRVGVQRPDASVGDTSAMAELRDEAMATSGDYRNYREVGGRRVSHIIDPRTGRPIEHHLASVSVVLPTAADADAWATALSVLGPDEGLRVADERGLAALLLVRAADGRFEQRPSALWRARAAR